MPDEELLEEEPESDDEKKEELDREAEKARDRATADLLKRMKALESEVTRATNSLKKFTERLPAVERLKSEPVRDPLEKGLDKSNAKSKGDKAVKKVLEANPDEPDPDDPDDPEKAKSKSEWQAGKWMAGLTAIVALGPVLLKLLDGIARIVRDPNSNLSDILDSGVEKELRDFVNEHRKETDEKFWGDVADRLGSKDPKPRAAELIYMFQFIATISPIETPYSWTSSDYDDLVDKVKAQYTTDPTGFVTMLPNLKGTSGPVPRGLAASLAQIAVATSIVSV